MARMRNYIGGEWVDGKASKVDVNPSDTADIVGEYVQGGAAEVEAAIDAAQAARGVWARTTIQERADILEAIGVEILSRREELGELLAREEGKTKADGVAEIGRAGQIFKFFAGEALRPGGERLPSIRPGIEIEITREPLGVVGLITPWNFPAAIPAWKIAPALAFGNCVVLKPADLVPATAWSLAEIISRTKLPKGVFNLVMGPGSAVGEAIIASKRIQAISFTGSIAVGARIAEAAGRNQVKIQLEMGGKNPLIVLDDADLKTAVECAANGAYFQTGQRCTASSRLIVTDKIHDTFVSALTERVQALKVDNALKPGTDMGPVVDARQLEQDLSYIEVGRGEGARLAFGGERLNRETQGFYLSPALFTETDNRMRINREEIFGPVASVIRVKDYDAALETANDTEFGLSAGIVTSSLKHAQHFRRNIESGLAMVNLPTAGLDYHVPFGGRKKSSFGAREQGAYAREFYTTVKTAYSTGL